MAKISEDRRETYPDDRPTAEIDYTATSGDDGWSMMGMAVKEAVKTPIGIALVGAIIFGPVSYGILSSIRSRAEASSLQYERPTRINVNAREESINTARHLQTMLTAMADSPSFVFDKETGKVRLAQEDSALVTAAVADLRSTWNQAEGGDYQAYSLRRETVLLDALLKEGLTVKQLYRFWDGASRNISNTRRREEINPVDESRDLNAPPPRPNLDSYHQ